MAIRDQKTLRRVRPSAATASPTPKSGRVDTDALMPQNVLSIEDLQKMLREQNAPAPKKKKKRQRSRMAA